MNRKLKIVFVTLGVLILLLFSTPFILKNSVLKQLKLAINEQVDGTIEYQSGEVSLVQTFPNLTVNIKNLSYSKGGDTASIEQCKLALNLFSVLNGKPYEITEISILSPKIALHYPTVQTPEETEQKQNNSKKNADNKRSKKAITQKEQPLLFSLKSLTISNGTFLLNDSKAHSKIEINGLNLKTLGTLTNSSDHYSTAISIDAIDLSLANFDYLKHQQLAIQNELSLDKKSKLINIETCKLKFNQFESSVSGTILQNGNRYETDIKLSSEHLTLKKLISLFYSPDSEIYNQIDAQGDVALNGFLKGDIGENNIPDFQISLHIEDGQIPLATAQDTIQKIDLHLMVGNNASQTTFAKLAPCRFMVGKNPFEISCNLETTDSLVHLSGDFYTQFELADLNKITALDSSISIKGVLTSKTNFETYFTDFKTIKNESLKIDGAISLQKCTLNTPELRKPISLKKATILIENEQIILNKTDLISDYNRLTISGKSHNLLSYFLEQEPVKGDLLVESDQLNINTLISNFQSKKEPLKPANTPPKKALQPTQSTVSKTEKITQEATEFTPTFELGINLKIDEATYNSTYLKKIASQITVTNQQIIVSKISFNQEKSDFFGTGKLSTFNAPIKTLESEIKANKFTFDQTLKLFPELKTSQPFLTNLSGTFTLELDGTVEISEPFKTNSGSLNSKGKLITSKIHVNDITELQKIAKKAKLKPLEKVDIDPLTILFQVKNGDLTVEPFEFKSGDISGVVSGTTSAKKELNYTIHVTVPRQAFNGQVNAIANNVLGKLSQFGIKPKLPEAITLDVRITGSTDNPLITTSL